MQLVTQLLSLMSPVKAKTGCSFGLLLVVMVVGS